MLMKLRSYSSCGISAMKPLVNESSGGVKKQGRCSRENVMIKLDA